MKNEEEISKRFTNTIENEKLIKVENLKKSLEKAQIFLILLAPILKIITLCLYLFSSLIFKTIILKVISILIAASLDYWLTKYFIGKKLTGLFFAKIYLDIEKKSKYFYRDFGEKVRKHKCNVIVFWFTQFFFLFFWMLILLFNILRWRVFIIILSFFPFVLILNNTYHFSRCVLSKEKILGKFFVKTTKIVLDNNDFNFN
jgi:hypothetical protein